MNELINILTSQLNVDDSQAKGGVGILLNLAKSKLSGGDFGQLATLLGGDTHVNTLIQAAPTGETATSGGGLFGALGGIASSLGVNLGSVGTLAQVAGSFKSLNMDSAVVQQFVPVVMKWLEEKGGENVKTILSSLMK